jgi:23S rRNA (cytosine1962-C5)-methyltransferase
VKGIYERSDVDVRRKEGLREETGLLWGEAPPELIQMGQEALIYLADVYKGHKTGFYLDQKPNHKVLEDLSDTTLHSDPDISLLNLFSYTGRFGLAFPGQVVNVDASVEALALAEKNYELSRFQSDQVEFIQADVFEFLRDQAAERQEYNVVILDPPKFAHNAGQVEKAARGYKDINLNAFKCVKPGGYLMTFSCSGAISADLFQKIVFGALVDSGRQAQILKHLSPGDDHPVALTFPEGAYLKGLLLRVY